MSDLSYRELYRRGTLSLAVAGVPDAELDARLLLESVCGTDRNYFYAHGEEAVSEAQAAAYSALLLEREKRIPLQQILKETVFMGLKILVDENVLIPRQDTECLVEAALRCMKDGERVLDLCTGSGCILLAMMHYGKEIDGYGTDLSEAALSVASENARALGISATWIKSDLFATLAGEKYDIIVSNPPYIPTDVIPTLQEEVRDHEPISALDGGKDGLDFYRIIVKDAPLYLNAGGRLLVEIGFDQGSAVEALLKIAGFQDVRVIRDDAGCDRVVLGHL